MKWWLTIIIVAVLVAGLFIPPLFSSDSYFVTENLNGNMRLSSASFEAGGEIPSIFTCDGSNINPDLIISDVPEDTVSLLLIVDDPDAPAGTADPGWVHWVVYGISPSTRNIPSDSIPGELGLNDWGAQNWNGPCPPTGEHEYVFRLYAINIQLPIVNIPTKAQLVRAIEGHIIESTTLAGTYRR